LVDFKDIVSLNKLQETLQGAWVQLGLNIVYCLMISYLLASTATSVFVAVLAKSAIHQEYFSRGEHEAKLPPAAPPLNYRTLRMVVLERNIFNSEGELPDEPENVGGEGEGGTKFDANARCSKSSIDLQLIGTIYLGSGGDSLATIQEKGYNEPDIYRPGEAIIGHANAVIFAIEHQKVIINNNGMKECLEIAPSKLGTMVANHGTEGEPTPAAEAAAASDSGGAPSSVTLSSAAVEEALGPGFSKILDSGRLVPHNKDNRMIGFKLIGVKSESLWRKVGLSSGDVITSVNGISMTQADQGFAFYQALQDAREIRVEYLRGGNTPANVMIEIR